MLANLGEVADEHTRWMGALARYSFLLLKAGRWSGFRSGGICRLCERSPIARPRAHHDCMKMRSPHAVVRPHLTLPLRGSLPLRPGGGEGRGEVGRRAELRQRALRPSCYFRGSEAIQW